MVVTPTSLELNRISRRFVEKIPIHFARRHTLIGLDTDHPEIVEVFASDAGQQTIVDNLGLTLTCEVHLRVASDQEIQTAINQAYQQRQTDIEEVASTITGPEAIDVENLEADGDLLDDATRAPVIKLVNLMLFDAVKRRASDLHVQAKEDGVVIRLRIDGVLFDYLETGGFLLEEIVSRIKVMGGMDIAEKRLPQDGRTTVRIGERIVDLRISTIPTAHGERAVLRLLDKSARLYELPELGIAEDVREKLAELIQRSHGMILITGPTGSGKSTTLYSALQQIDYQKLNVVTLEDPIEYHLPGISQTQVSARKGMTFAKGLRSLLRQDPDVIMVGEIRDVETARLAIQSSLTGHLVLSTLHTNDAPGAVARLLDLGIEPYLVADSLLAVGAQRLVRKVCQQCSSETAPSKSELRELRIEARDLPTYMRGAGCETCGQTGYFDRICITELIEVNEPVRQLIHQRAQASQIRELALQHGMRTLRQDGIRQVKAGLTTPAEVLRVTQLDYLASEWAAS